MTHGAYLRHGAKTYVEVSPLPVAPCWPGCTRDENGSGLENVLVYLAQATHYCLVSGN